MSKNKFQSMFENIRVIAKLKSRDLILITSEGEKVKTHAILLGAFSSWLGEILKNQMDS